MFLNFICFISTTTLCRSKHHYPRSLYRHSDCPPGPVLPPLIQQTPLLQKPVSSQQPFPWGPCLHLSRTQQDASTLCHSRHHHPRSQYRRSDRPPGACASFSLSNAWDTTLEASIPVEPSIYFPSLLPQQRSLQWNPVLSPEEAASSLTFASPGAPLFIQYCCSSVAPAGAFSLFYTATVVQLLYEPSIFLHYCRSSTRSNGAQSSSLRQLQLLLPSLPQEPSDSFPTVAVLPAPPVA